MTNQSPLMVGLYLHGDELEPELITQNLGVEPTSSHLKGEKWITITGKTVIRKTGMWYLEANTDSQILSEHIDELASKIKLSVQSIYELPGVEYAKIDVYMGYVKGQKYKIGYSTHKGGSDTTTFDLTKENVSVIRRFGVPMEFTIVVT